TGSHRSTADSDVRAADESQFGWRFGNFPRSCCRTPNIVLVGDGRAETAMEVIPLVSHGDIHEKAFVSCHDLLHPSYVSVQFGARFRVFVVFDPVELNENRSRWPQFSQKFTLTSA